MALDFHYNYRNVHLIDFNGKRNEKLTCKEIDYSLHLLCSDEPWSPFRPAVLNSCSFVFS